MTRAPTKESPTLRAARRALAVAEASFREAVGLAQLQAGLALLDDVCAQSESRTAENLAASYALAIGVRIGDLIASDPALPEPELEHCFKMLLAFDQCRAELPARARDTKVEIVRRLIDRYYEGHPAADKQRALEQLTVVTGE